jgi:hypothetical protein
LSARLRVRYPFPQAHDGRPGRTGGGSDLISLWTIVRSDDPIVATAIHDGHVLRDDVSAIHALSETERLREEDPFTGRWTAVAPTRIVPLRSRFEVDLNRPRERAVYLRPGDAWDLSLWKQDPPADLIASSLAEYDAFYSMLGEVLSHLVGLFGRVVVLDLHTYNHRRQGPDRPAADPEANPEVNVGTGSMDRELFRPVVDRFIGDLRGSGVRRKRPDVRENVKFLGGHMSRWIHRSFPGTVCALAVEFKKVFMDEWSGVVDEKAHREIAGALAETIPGLREEIRGLARR